MSFFNIFLIIWSIIGLITFVYLFFENAPYGRHIKKGWGTEIPARLGWIVMESPCVVLIILLTIIFYENLNAVHYIFLILWLAHYIHRTFIYPFMVDMENQKMPISIPISAISFNFINVSIQFYGIFLSGEYSYQWLMNPYFCIGVGLFISGMYINIRSDYYMISLRKTRGPGYHQPNSFLYKYISSPNYFGEMIEWLGWAILTASSAGLIFFFWTVANLFPRAIAHHKWYKKRFENYPKNRKAVIPGVI